MEKFKLIFKKSAEAHRKKLEQGKKLLLLSIIIGGCFISFSLAQAKTTFYFEGQQPDKKSLEFLVSVKVDSDKPLNAYDLVVQFPRNLIHLKRFDTQDSIIDVWKSLDMISENEMRIQGGSTKPFEGENGKLVTFIFEAVMPGKDNFVFRKASAYLADGQGTLADEVIIQNVPLVISQAEIEGQSSNLFVADVSKGTILKTDKTPPQISVFKIEPNPFDSNQMFLIFEAKDNDSGISKILVRTKGGIKWSEWQETKNPHAFSKNIWAIQLLVVDNFNNATTKTEYFWSNLLEKIGIFVGLIVLVFVLVFIVKKKIKK